MAGTHEEMSKSKDAESDTRQNSDKSHHDVTTFSTYKNLITISAGYLLLFSSFNCLLILQSSLNISNALGTTGLAVTFGVGVVACLFVPTAVIHYIGCKWTLVTSMTAFLLYTIANFHPTWATIIPASALVGLGNSALWSAKAAYITRLAQERAEKTGQKTNAVVSSFFGILFLAFQASYVFGNVASYFVLADRSANASQGAEEYLHKCGSAFCAREWAGFNLSQTNLKRPSDEKVYTLIGIYTACVVLAMAVTAVLLENRKWDTEEGTAKVSAAAKLRKLVIAAVKQWKTKEQWLVWPINTFLGLELAYVGADYTQAFVSCTSGISRVGIALICFGAVDAVSSFLLTRFSHYTGRWPLCVVGFLSNLAACTTMLLWQPKGDEFGILLVVAALWGVGDSIWNTQIRALYAALWPKKTEPAFANCVLCMSLGYAIGFAYSEPLCAYVKLYLLIAILCVGILGYAVAELILHRRADAAPNKSSSSAAVAMSQETGGEGSDGQAAQFSMQGGL